MAASADTRIGTRIGGYQLEELIGRGGMGVVYRAFDPRLKRRVALKLVAPELSGDPRFRERFLRETELAASLDHPNVIPVYEAGEHEGQLFLAMRYVDGSDLKTVLATGPLQPARAVAICAQVAAALDAAHERGLVHRDVKPSNVLLDSSEHAYLADFGLTSSFHAGRLAGEDLSLGTPAYAAPEQILGRQVDGRADVYSLACVLYECLTGETPFVRGSELATLFAHLHDEPPTIPSQPALDPVLERALAHDPGQRYASCAELTDAAREALGLREVMVVRDRKPLLLAALGLIAIAAAVAIALVLMLRNDQPRPDLTVTANTVVKIDPDTNEIAAVTKVGRGPESIATGGDAVWVYNWDDRTVSMIDAATGRVTRTRSISGSPPFTSGSISIAADRNGAWVLSNAGGTGLLTRVHADDRLPQEHSFPYDPVSIAVGERAVWVGAKSVRGNVVLRIDPRTGTFDAAVPLRNARIDPQSSFRDIRSVAVGEGAVWALLGGTTFRIDPASARVTGTVNLPGNEAMQVVAGDGAVWALTFVPAGRKQLIRIDPRALRITKTVAAPDVPGAGSSNFTGSVALGHGAVWWNGAETGTVWRVEPRSGTISATTRFTPPAQKYADPQPYAIAASADDVWVSARVPP